MFHCHISSGELARNVWESVSPFYSSLTTWSISNLKKSFTRTSLYFRLHIQKLSSKSAHQNGESNFHVPKFIEWAAAIPATCHQTNGRSCCILHKHCRILHCILGELEQTVKVSFALKLYFSLPSETTFFWVIARDVIEKLVPVVSWHLIHYNDCECDYFF